MDSLRRPDADAVAALGGRPTAYSSDVDAEKQDMLLHCSQQLFLVNPYPRTLRLLQRFPDVVHYGCRIRITVVSETHFPKLAYMAFPEDRTAIPVCFCVLFTFV